MAVVMMEGAYIRHSLANNISQGINSANIYMHNNCTPMPIHSGNLQN